MLPGFFGLLLSLASLVASAIPDVARSQTTSFCGTLETPRLHFVLKRVRLDVSQSTPAAERMRAATQLPYLAASEVSLVTDEAECQAASIAHLRIVFPDSVAPQPRTGTGIFRVGPDRYVLFDGRSEHTVWYIYRTGSRERLASAAFLD